MHLCFQINTLLQFAPFQCWLQVVVYMKPKNNIIFAGEAEQPSCFCGKSMFSKCCNFLCGLQEQQATSPDESADERQKLMTENKKWKNIVNINAVIALAAMCFLCGAFY